MIKQIFLPEKIGSYYLFSKRILGVDISKTHIHATTLKMRGTLITIEQCMEMAIEATQGTNSERIQATLEQLIQKIGSIDEIHSSLSSTLAIFKELKLPFLQYEKLKKVVPFEVEPLLPFPLQDAIIDFIITNQNIVEKGSDIFVAAIQKQHIAHHVHLFEKLSVSPNKLLIDMFSLYGLFKSIPSYAHREENIVLIDFGMQATRIVFIEIGTLKSIRSLSKGIAQLVKAISDQLETPTNQIMEFMIRFGFEKSDWLEYNQAMQKTLTTFWQEINFTLSSFTALSGKPIDRILLLGEGAQIKDITSFAHSLLGISCEYFDATRLAENKSVILKNKHMIPSTCIVSLATAFPSAINKKFNLLKNEFSTFDAKSILIQTITGLVLFVALVTILFIFTILQTGKLKTELKKSDLETLAILKETFKKIPEDEEDLEEAIKFATQEIKKEKETWFAFTRTRSSFLKYLLELVSKIDKEALGFVINKLTISNNNMILNAQVRDYEALKLLERELKQSKLFTYVEPQTETEFSMKITLANGER